MTTKTKALFLPRIAPAILVKSATNPLWQGIGATVGDAIAKAQWLTRGAVVLVTQCAADGTPCPGAAVYRAKVNAGRNGLAMAENTLSKELTPIAARVLE